MKAKENAKYMAYRNLVEYVSNNSARAQLIPAFVRYINELEAKLDQITAAEDKAQLTTEGVTKEKQKLKKGLKDEIVILGKAMLAHAIDIDNVVLETQVKSLNSRLSKARQAEFPMQCKNVVDEAQKHIANLADHGITAEQLTNLSDKIETMKSKNSGSKKVSNARKLGVQKRTDIFSEIDNLVNKQIKNAATSFVGKDDDFFNNIVTSMKVQKPFSSTTQIKAVLKSDVLQRSIMTQTARVLDIDIVESSNKKGEIIFKIPKSGIYAIEVPMPNGEVRTINDIKVKRGRTTVVEVA